MCDYIVNNDRVFCCSRCGLPGQEQLHEQMAVTRLRAVAGSTHHEERAGKEIRKGLHPERRWPVRLDRHRGLLPRVLRRAGPQIRRAGRATAPVVHQLEGVPVAPEPVQPVVHRRAVQRLRGADDVRGTGREHRVRRVQHLGQPSGVHSAATGHHARVLRVRRTRAQA